LDRAVALARRSQQWRGEGKPMRRNCAIVLFHLGRTRLCLVVGTIIVADPAANGC
jgi:hypothetical protein